MQCLFSLVTGTPTGSKQRFCTPRAGCFSLHASVAVHRRTWRCGSCGNRAARAADAPLAFVGERAPVCGFGKKLRTCSSPVNDPGVYACGLCRLCGLLVVELMLLITSLRADGTARAKRCVLLIAVVKRRVRSRLVLPPSLSFSVLLQNCPTCGRLLHTARFPFPGPTSHGSIAPIATSSPLCVTSRLQRNLCLI